MPIFEVPANIFVDAEDADMAVKLAFEVLNNGRDDAYVDGAELVAYAVVVSEVKESDEFQRKDLGEETVQ